MLTQRAISTPVPSSVPAACPKCGIQLSTDSEEAHRRIQDLETQVRALNFKAAAAVDKLADYEDEVRALRAQCARLQPAQPAQPAVQSPPTVQTPDLVESPSQPTVQNGVQISPPRTSSRLASLSSFFGSRARDSNVVATTPTGLQAQGSLTPITQPPSLNTTGISTLPSPLPAQAQDRGSGLTDPETPPPLPARPDQAVNVQTLQSSLESERTRRVQAETSLNQTQTELEELTAQLFGQANEMVAAERKARAKLEERVKVLEDRDGEKRRRLERLEKALQRIERVRGLVERRNTVDGVVDRKERLRLNGATISEDEDEDRNTFEGGGSSMNGSGIEKENGRGATEPSVTQGIKRKAVAAGVANRDLERDRPKGERKGTV